MGFFKRFKESEKVRDFWSSTTLTVLLFIAYIGVTVASCVICYRLGKDDSELVHTPSVLQYAVQQMDANPYFALGRKSSFNQVARLMEEMSKRLNSDKEAMKFIIFGLDDKDQDQQQLITIIITTTSGKQLKGTVKSYGQGLDEGAMVIVYLKPGERYY